MKQKRKNTPFKDTTRQFVVFLFFFIVALALIIGFAYLLNDLLNGLEGAVGDKNFQVMSVACQCGVVCPIASLVPLLHLAQQKNKVSSHKNKPKGKPKKI